MSNGQYPQSVSTPSMYPSPRRHDYFWRRNQFCHKRGRLRRSSRRRGTSRSQGTNISLSVLSIDEGAETDADNDPDILILTLMSSLYQKLGDSIIYDLW
mmetsp:Transcript_14137/g.15366  ORF Transcript_14137/g.15366 Transcript_14137/m.15366 type:complete len:99 (+) Transcript_14137:762-1058(+)